MLWRGFPAIVRGTISKYRTFNKCKDYLKHHFARWAAHNDVYDEAFYESVEKWDYRSCSVIAASVVCDLRPVSVLDVGCGTGALMHALKKAGVSSVFGVELSDEALKICHSKGLDVTNADLCKLPQLPYGKVDLVACMEVAEHIPESCAMQLVRLLIQSSNRIVFSAATPGQGGVSHLNEQEHAYWVKKFQEHDFVLDKEVTSRWRRQWCQKDALANYYANVMLFVRNDVV